MKKVFCSLFFLLATLPLVKQGNAQPSARYIGASDLSLTYGYKTGSFEYPAPNATFDYAFKAPQHTLYLLNRNFTFSVRYGVQEEDLAENLVNMKLVEGSLSGGPNLRILRPVTELGISLSLPIRAGLDYRFVHILDDEIRPDAPNLYLLEPYLGGGLGFAVHPTWLDSRLRLMGSVVSTFGIQNELADQYPDDLRLLRKDDFDMEVRLNNVLGNLGFALGFSARSIRWSDETAEAFTDKFEIVTKPSRLPRRVSQNVFRVGIVWHERRGR